MAMTAKKNLVTGNFIYHARFKLNRMTKDFSEVYPSLRQVTAKPNK